MKTLVIDILSPPSTSLNNKNCEVLFNILGFMKKAEEIAINLTDKSFSHFLITIGNISPNYICLTNVISDIININPFTYIIIDQYSFFW